VLPFQKKRIGERVLTFVVGRCNEPAAHPTRNQSRHQFDLRLPRDLNDGIEAFDHDRIDHRTIVMFHYPVVVLHSNVFRAALKGSVNPHRLKIVPSDDL